MNKETGILASIVLITIIVASIVIYATNKDTTTSSGTVVSDIWRSDAPHRGSESAKVKVVEFADFQCPTCKSVEPMLTQILQERSNDVQMQFRYFPLTTIHKNALNSAVAAYVASKDGKFWEMAQYLYENQTSWAESSDPKETFAKFGVLAGLDEAKFNDAYTNRTEALSFIKVDQDKAAELQLPGTPTLFINGKQYSGNLTKNDIDAAIKAEL